MRKSKHGLVVLDGVQYSKSLAGLLNSVSKDDSNDKAASRFNKEETNLESMGIPVIHADSDVSWK